MHFITDLLILIKVEVFFITIRVYAVLIMEQHGVLLTDVAWVHVHSELFPEISEDVKVSKYFRI